MNTQLLDYIQRLSLADKKNLTQKTLKGTEEMGDLAKVVLSYENAFATTHRFVTREQILSEVADVILCVMSVAYDTGYTHDEIAAEVHTKAEKWASMQAKEEGVTYPLPYEAHVTVKLDGSDSETARFIDVCTAAGIKPIVLALDTKGEQSIIDVMTSSKHLGNNSTAYGHAMGVASLLKSMKFDVCRVKLETVPWHPMAPKDGQPMPPNTYFEAHLPVVLPSVDDVPTLRRVVYDLEIPQLHMSANVFKKNKDGSCVQMVTYRRTDRGRDEFAADVEQITSSLKCFDWTVGKYHTEFALYDTNVSHDAAWTNTLRAASATTE